MAMNSEIILYQSKNRKAISTAIGQTPEIFTFLNTTTCPSPPISTTCPSLSAGT